MKSTEKEISNIRREIKGKEKQIESNNKELEKVFADLNKGSPTLITEEQLVSRSKAPDLGA
jgi:predicted  nucleic acid-binding Zn-ribbon protein